MTDVKEKAIELITELSDDKVVYIIQILQSLKGIYGQTDSTMSNDWDKEKAFEALEKLRKKFLNWIMKKNWQNRGKKGMRILIDTNILLDYIAEREPYAEFSRKIV